MRQFNSKASKSEPKATKRVEPKGTKRKPKTNPTGAKMDPTWKKNGNKIVEKELHTVWQRHHRKKCFDQRRTKEQPTRTYL